VDASYGFDLQAVQPQGRHALDALDGRVAVRRMGNSGRAEKESLGACRTRISR